MATDATVRPAVAPKEKQSLYDIAADALAWEALVVEAEGEITTELAEFEMELTATLKAKSDGIGGYLKQLDLDEAAEEGRVEAIKQELARRQAKVKAIGARRSRMHGMIDTALTMTGAKEFKGEYFTLYRHGNGGKQPLELLVKEEAIPDTFYDIPNPPPVLNKDRLRAALEAQDPIATTLAQLLPRGYRIAIK